MVFVFVGSVLFGFWGVFGLFLEVMLMLGKEVGKVGMEGGGEGRVRMGGEEEDGGMGGMRWCDMVGCC